MVDKIIAEYLKSGRRLIVPELGVFIKRENKDEIIFSTLLTKNDGILLQMIQDRIHMPEEKAVIILNHYVNEINRQLDVVGKFSIEGLGTLIKKGDDIDFIYSGDKNTEFIYRKHMSEIAQNQSQQQTVSQNSESSDKKEQARTITPSADKKLKDSLYTEAQPFSSKKVDEPFRKNMTKDISEANRKLENELQQQTKTRQYRTQKPKQGGKKADMVLIIAIIAAILAISIIIYGALVQKPEGIILDQQDTEQVFDVTAPDAAETAS